MSYVVCWLDSEEAKIFSLSPEGIKKTDLKIKEEEKTQHKKGDMHHHDSKAFYDRVANELKSAKEILLVGPGMAKKHFKTFIDDHKALKVSDKVVGVENMDHPTDKQIVAEARKFFRAHDLFESLNF